MGILELGMLDMEGAQLILGLLVSASTVSMTALVQLVKRQITAFDVVRMQIIRQLHTFITRYKGNH